MHIQPACLNKFLFQIDQSLFLSQFFNAKSWQSQEKSYSNAAQYFLPNRSQMKTRKKHSRKWAWFINRNRITTRKNFSTHKTGTKTTRRQTVGRHVRELRKSNIFGLMQSLIAALTLHRICYSLQFSPHPLCAVHVPFAYTQFLIL